MRDQLKFTNLPCVQSIRNWITLKLIQPGVNEAIFGGLAKRILEMEDKERDIILSFDEMTSRRNFTYNKKLDNIDGFHDYGNGQRLNILSKDLCTFFIRSLHMRYDYKIPIACYAFGSVFS